MRVVMCAMAKNEHLYINEWVEHYINIGVDKIYLYDNDDQKDTYVGRYISEPYKPMVEIIDIRGVRANKLQQWVYNDFYNKKKDTFEWCLFCDIDEFLVGVDNIKTWLDPIKAPQVRIMWRLFGDDNLIERDMNKSVMETFKTQIHSSLHRNLIYKGDLEIQGKFVLKGGLKDVVITSPHFASFGIRNQVIPSVLPSGRVCRNSDVRIRENYSQETIYLNHYMTKSLKEFIDQKLGRNDAVYNQNLKLDYYWRINKKTKEKLEYLKNMGLIV